MLGKSTLAYFPQRIENKLHIPYSKPNDFHGQDLHGQEIPADFHSPEMFVVSWKSTRGISEHGDRRRIPKSVCANMLSYASRPVPYLRHPCEPGIVMFCSPLMVSK